MQTVSNNHLLSSLSTRGRRSLLKESILVHFSPGQSLYDANETHRFVHFPCKGLVSLAIPQCERRVEVAAIGNEGMVEYTAILGFEFSQYQEIVREECDAVRVRADHLRQHMASRPHLRHHFLAYLYTLMEHMILVCVCNRIHPLEQRLARLLLMHEKEEDVPYRYITQQMMGEMLGVHRFSITHTANLLREKGLIDYSRGKMKILDVAGLKAVACGCYGEIVKRYKRLLKKQIWYQ